MVLAQDKKAGCTERHHWNLCRMHFWSHGTAAGCGGGGGIASSSSSSNSLMHHGPMKGMYGKHGVGDHFDGSNSGGSQLLNSGIGSGSASASGSLGATARALLPARRRLRLDPANKLYFPYEPGKQVRSAVRIKNISKSHVAFKFQTTAPKSCFMRPPGAILAPGESIVTTVFKFVEQPENDENLVQQKCKVKFKIMSLKVKGHVEYAPEMFEEDKDQIVIEQISRVVFLDVNQPSTQLEKLNSQLAEADAAVEASKKPPQDHGPNIADEGPVIDEWKERRERFLAKQQVNVIDSVQN